MADMSFPPRLTGPEMDPAEGGLPRAVVVFLHGVGADGQDLIGLAPRLGQSLPFARFVSPNAPFPFDMAPFGHQWFSLRDLSAEAKLAGARAAAPLLDAFLDSERDRAGIGDDKMAILGFSQGTMMALFTGLRRPKPLAGIVGFSGALLGADVLAQDIKSRPPVLLIHGSADPVVPVTAAENAEKALAAVGVDVSAHIRPDLGHGIDEVGLEMAAEFLADALGQG